jgi:hypothetical protein
MSPVRGVRLVDLGRHADARGSLLAFGNQPPLPFDIRNVYFILDCPPDAIRAGRAGSGDTAIIALRSGVTVDLDNGRERGSERLSKPDTVLVVKAGVWHRLREFSRETTLVVLSSLPFREAQHFDHPKPALVDEVQP